MVAGAGSENERAKKIKKLNESFLKWAAKQIETHPLSIWKEGVKVRGFHAVQVRTFQFNLILHAYFM